MPDLSNGLPMVEDSCAYAVLRWLPRFAMPVSVSNLVHRMSWKPWQVNDAFLRLERYGLVKDNGIEIGQETTYTLTPAGRDFVEKWLSKEGKE